MQNENKKLKFFILGGLALLLFVIFVFSAHAQEVNVGLTQVGEGLGLPATDIRVIVANIIRIALGLLGIIFIGILIYGGYLYLTAGGNEEQVTSAKSWLGRGVIGLAIILTSFAIAQFVLQALLRATGAGPGAGGGAGGGGPGGGGLPASAFVVRGITPRGPTRIRNVRVVASFSQSVDAASLGGNFIVFPTGNPGSPVAGTPTVTDNRIEFIPDSPCPAPAGGERCFDADRDFTVAVGSGLRSASGLSILCGGLAPTCEGVFRTGNLIDTEGPRVSMIVPPDGASVSENADVPLQARATDDAGIARVQFDVDGSAVGSSVPGGASPLDYLTPIPPDLQAVTWDTRGVVRGPHTIIPRAFDIDSHLAIGNGHTVAVRAEHCFDGIQDGGESGLDCGGPDCGGCGAARCNAPLDCRSGICRNNQCVEVPMIESVDPMDAAGVPNGKPGNYVTIRGQFFGATAGTVTFVGPATGALVNAPLAACASAWGPTQIVIEVPAGAASGPVSVVAANNEKDATNDSRGPLVSDFQINNVARPGICGLDPSRGRPGETFTATGQGLGAPQGGSTLAVGGRGAIISSWTDSRVAAAIPVLAAGVYRVVATVGGVPSNSVALGVVAEQSGRVPEIISFDPASSGAPGSLLTLLGRNFGTSVGVVRFQNPTHGFVVGDIQLPIGCTESFWRDTAITVRVPRELRAHVPMPLASWNITVERPDGAASVPRSWTTDASALRPGLCALTPDNGPIGTQVTFAGERLNGSGEVIFSQNKIAPTSIWTDEQVLATVPGGSVSGLVKARVAGMASNERPFLVQDCRSAGCGQGQACCGNGVCVPEGEACLGGPRVGGYAWRFSTGVIPVAPRVVEECATGEGADLPSPSPWHIRGGGSRVCANATISARFTSRIDDTSLQSSLRVEKCAGADIPNSCQTVEPVLGALTIFDTDSGAQEGFTFDPATALTPSSTYRVTLTNALRGEGAEGAPIVRSEAACRGFAPDCAYAFTFSTRNPMDTCSVGSVVVDPVTYVANHRGPIKNQDDKDVLWRANVRSREDQCVLLNARGFDFDWFSTDPLRADVSNRDQDPADGRQDPTQVGEAKAESGRDASGRVIPAKFTAMIRRMNVSGWSEVVVDFEDPRVTSFWPSCGSACVNAGIGAEFSEQIKSDPDDPASITHFPNVQLLTSLCGNARQDAGEDCDDGNETAGDGCSASCTNEGTSPAAGGGACGNGRREAGEDCDGNPFPARCSPACLNQGTDAVAAGGACGNAVVDAGEDCDGGLRCSSRCLHQGTSGLRPVSIASLDYDPLTRRVNITPEGGLLDPNASYQVIILGAVRSTDGVPLTGLNYGSPPSAYSWNFHSASGDALCTLDRVEMAPRNITVRAIGAERGVSAYPVGAPNACSPTGERLNPTAYNWSWNSSEARVARVTNLDAHPACGNRVKEIGEDCDDGNEANGDGCSSACTHEGSGTYPVLRPGDEEPRLVTSICGNGALEIGEDCDGSELRLPPAIRPPVRSGDGCSDQCLNEGSFAGRAICGDGVVALGEDCDDGNTGNNDGCASQCLHEGTLIDRPSRIDPEQTARAVGVLPGASEGMSQISALTEGKSSRIDFTLMCGFHSNQECVEVNGDPAVGLGANTCCYPRPRVVNVSERPADGMMGVCRNPQISVIMDTFMDPGSIQGNIIVDQAQPRCPTASSTVGVAGPELFWCEGLVQGVTSMFDDEIARQSTLALGIGRILATTTDYRVRLIGDNPETPQNEGIRSRDGVTMAGNFEWTFRTGREICRVDMVGMTPRSLFFQTANPPRNTRTLVASALSRHEGRIEAIAPTPDYLWSWRFESRDETIALADRAERERSPVVAQNKNGETAVTATAKVLVSSDLEEVDRETMGAAPVKVFICENPWTAPPPVGPLPPEIGFVDSSTNFKVTYCRDRGKPHDTTDDFPVVSVVPVPAPPPGRGILREWLLPVLCGGLQTCKPGDALGIRVVANPLHRSAEDWYREQPFGGSPQTMTVDGYGAVRDGRTVYVHAANVTHPTAGKGYTNIYIFSYNDGASADTQAIFNSMLANFRFNINLITEETKQCVSDGRAVRVCAGEPGTVCVDDDACRDKGPCVSTSCVADYQCPGASTCAAPQEKLRRDVKRFEQAYAIDAALEVAYGKKGKYPTLASGSFVPGFTTSKWPSWSAALGNEAGAALPTDPVNQFAACGGYDAATCWNEETRRFLCAEKSRVYQYESRLGGEQYVMSADLEFASPMFFWEQPPPRPRARPGKPANDFMWSGSCRGVAVSPRTGVCGNGVREGGEVCDAESPHTYARCDAGGGRTGVVEQRCASDCSGIENVPGARCVAGVCGDGIIHDSLGCNPATGLGCARGHGPAYRSPGEVCDDGGLNGVYGHCNATCTAYGAHCGDGVIASPEICDSNDPGIAEIAQGICSQTGAKCSGDGDCPGLLGEPRARDICLGTTVYALHENKSCAADCLSRGPFCGDRVISNGEACDGNVETTPNGLCAVRPGETPRPCTTNTQCPSNDCRIPNDRTKHWQRACTDQCTWSDWMLVSAGRECGNGVVDRGICVGGDKDRQACGGDNDCRRLTYAGRDGICGEACDDGNDNNSDRCISVRDDSGAVDRNRSCRVARCGDAFVRAGYETCDIGDGRSPKNGDRCTPGYGASCNYCSINCSEETITGGVCGDGVIQAAPAGPEVCEGGEFAAGYPRVADSQCLPGCTAACPPAYTAFTPIFRTDPIPGFCAHYVDPIRGIVREGSGCTKDVGEGGCNAYDYCDTSRFRSQGSSVNLENGEFIGLPIPACRSLSRIDLVVVPHASGDEAVRNINLILGMDGVRRTQRIDTPGLVQLTSLPPRQDGSPFRCAESAQLLHVGVSFSGAGTIELRFPSIQACRP